MGTKKLDGLLFQKLKMVGLPPTRTIEPFDLLVVDGGGTWGRGIRLANIGSFLNYRRNSPGINEEEGFHDPDGEFGRYEELIKLGLQALEDDPFRRDFPGREEGSVFAVRLRLMEFTERVSAACGLGAKLYHFLVGQCSASGELEYTFINALHHAVKDEVIHKLFIGDETRAQPPLWKPDTQKIKRASRISAQGGPEQLQLWLVNERVMCEELEIGGATSASVEGSVPVPVDGVGDAGANAHRSAEATRLVRSHQVGFKAIRLFYNSDAHLLNWFREDMGDIIPVLRHHGSEDPRLHDPLHHMGGLFLEPPPEFAVGEAEPAYDSLECLDVEPLNNLES